MSHFFGEGVFIAPNVDFEQHATVGHHSVIGCKNPLTGTRVILGEDISIGSFCILENNIKIGKYVTVDHYSCIYSGAKIGNYAKILYGAKIFANSIIGNYCIVGGDIPERMVLADRVTFMGIVAHSHRDASLDWDTTDEPSPMIGEGSVIGERALLIGGISIGYNCYVGAGEILRHDLPDNFVYLKGKSVDIKEFKGLIKTRFEHAK